MAKLKNLILPCCGLSSRFDGSVPKFLLENPNKFNMTMVISSITGLPYTVFDKIYVIVLESHCIEFNVIDKLKSDAMSLGVDIEVVQLPGPTNSASETVYQSILATKLTGEIYIKDCDSYFEVDSVNPNEITIVSLNECGRIHASNKSYVKINDQDVVNTIVEKNVISPYFCSGLYSFKTTHDFIKSYESLIDIQDSEIYISHVIFNMMLNHSIFKINRATNYIDWGTQEDWDIYLKL